jgi:hypothetical protein
VGAGHAELRCCCSAPARRSRSVQHERPPCSSLTASPGAARAPWNPRCPRLLRCSHALQQLQLLALLQRLLLLLVRLLLLLLLLCRRRCCCNRRCCCCCCCGCMPRHVMAVAGARKGGGGGANAFVFMQCGTSDRQRHTRDRRTRATLARPECRHVPATCQHSDLGPAPHTRPACGCNSRHPSPGCWEETKTLIHLNVLHKEQQKAGTGRAANALTTQAN